MAFLPDLRRIFVLKGNTIVTEPLKSLVAADTKLSRSERLSVNMARFRAGGCCAFLPRDGKGFTVEEFIEILALADAYEVEVTGFSALSAREEVEKRRGREEEKEK